MMSWKDDDFEYQTGLMVTEARLLVVDPPEEVKDAFHDVVRAWEDRERLMREVEGYRKVEVIGGRVIKKGETVRIRGIRGLTLLGEQA
jgi:membrane protease subunit HflK